MEKGVKVLIRILAGAALLGLLVILFNRDYRETAHAMLRGNVEASPIWQSNLEYYRDVEFRRDGADHE
ncbi:MAG TPA: hypothetical protein PJ991_05575 [Kiritimatiellia bacterium]|nr:hypothetical protein [Kiritimatiellia bacterium]